MIGAGAFFQTKCTNFSLCLKRCDGLGELFLKLYSAVIICAELFFPMLRLPLRLFPCRALGYTLPLRFVSLPFGLLVGRALGGEGGFQPADFLAKRDDVLGALLVPCFRSGEGGFVGVGGDGLREQ